MHVLSSVAIWNKPVHPVHSILATCDSAQRAQLNRSTFLAFAMQSGPFGSSSAAACAAPPVPAPAQPPVPQIQTGQPAQPAQQKVIITDPVPGAPTPQPPPRNPLILNMMLTAHQVDALLSQVDQSTPEHRAALSHLSMIIRSLAEMENELNAANQRNLGNPGAPQTSQGIHPPGQPLGQPAANVQGPPGGWMPWLV